MRRFRFRLARLLELRERAEGARCDQLVAAREAVRSTQEEIETARLERSRARLALEEVDAPGAAARRNDLILDAEVLDARRKSLEADLATRRRAEEDALAALFVAVRERKVLALLRERRKLEHLHEENRAEQAALDDMAQRSRAGDAEPPGTAFPDRQDLPGEPLASHFRCNPQ